MNTFKQKITNFCAFVIRIFVFFTIS